MTTTMPTDLRYPLTSALDRPTAMRLAATEYARFTALLRSLSTDDWTKPTDCPQWDVRAMASHVLGMAEMAASVRESIRQPRAARKAGGVFLDALTGLQVAERASMQPDDIVSRYARVDPKAARSRRRFPGFMLRRTMPDTQEVQGRDEAWTFGYLIDTILTRDVWMHRVDITRATGVAMTLTAEHDGAIVADVAAEWARRHGRPCALRLSGPAGGSWSWGEGVPGEGEPGEGRPAIELDAVEFCRIASGRSSGADLLDTLVPF